METLKSLIPEDLLQTVKSSSVDDLLTSTSSLLRLLLGLPQFHQVRKIYPKSTLLLGVPIFQLELFS